MEDVEASMEGVTKFGIIFYKGAGCSEKLGVFVFGRQVWFFEVSSGTYEPTSYDGHGGFAGKVVSACSRRSDQLTFPSAHRPRPARSFLGGPAVSGSLAGFVDARAFLQLAGGTAGRTSHVANLCAFAQPRARAGCPHVARVSPSTGSNKAALRERTLAPALARGRGELPQDRGLD